MTAMDVYIPPGAPYSRFNLASPSRPSIMTYRQPPTRAASRSNDQSITQPSSAAVPSNTLQVEKSPVGTSPSSGNQLARPISPSPHSPNAPSPLRAPSTPDFVTRFTNCRIVQGNELVQRDLWIQRGKIIDPASRFWQAHQSNEYAADLIIDCAGKILSPGFIDIQINGAFGFDFTQPMQSVRAGDEPVEPNHPVINQPTDQSIIQPSEQSNTQSNDQSEQLSHLSINVGHQYDQSTLENTVAKGLKRVSLGLLKHGCTAYCPTLITSSHQQYSDLLPLYRPRPGSVNTGAAILGVHCEGPFLTRKGAHTESLMINHAVQLPALVEMYGEEPLTDVVKVVTVAPEIPGMRDCIAYTKERFPDLIVSMGHSSANFDTAESAAKCGATLLTHLFNAMIPFTHRDPGITGLIGHNSDELMTKLFYSLICDDIHTHPASVKLAYQSHREGAIIVTDAMAAMGLDQSINQLTLGQTQVTIESFNNSRRAVVTGTQTLAGSIASIDESIRTFKKATNCSLVEALHAASLHPARCLGLNHKGRLEVGCDADIVVIDDQCQVEGVWIAGDKAWCQPGAIRVINQSQQTQN